jgi:hypothetical protein
LIGAQEATNAARIAIAAMRNSPVALRDRAFGNPLPLLAPGRDGAKRALVIKFCGIEVSTPGGET